MKLLLVLILVMTTNLAFAKKLKIALMAPKGTTWADVVKDMSKDIKKATDGKVKIKTYYGGVQGDEPDVLRKIRVGQLHGGVFTGRTLGEIFGDMRLVEVPFTFYHDYGKAQSTITKMTQYFNKGFEKSGMKNLGFFDIGPVYLFSKKKAVDLNSLKGVKIWQWEGDKVVESLMKSLGLVSVPLSLPDVLSSLSTGVIDAAYNSPLGALALQWQTKIKYVVDFPVSYATSALLVDLKAWNKIKPEHQKAIEEIAGKYTKKANALTLKENEEALKTMKDMKIEFIKFPKADTGKSNSVRTDVIKRLKTEKVFSNEGLKLLKKSI